LIANPIAIRIKTKLISTANAVSKTYVIIIQAKMQARQIVVIVTTKLIKAERNKNAIMILEVGVPNAFRMHESYA